MPSTTSMKARWNSTFRCSRTCRDSRTLSTNLAGRWTKYSSFDAVESWKVGLNWQVIDSMRFRSTLSSDIRAPNLNDLFQPVGVTSTGSSDRLTGGSNQGQRLVTRGNPDLTPEEAKTVTVGVVLTPTAIPRFSVSVDFYETKLTNAITNITYQNDAIQGLCLASAPAYDSPFCDAGDSPDHGSDRSQLPESGRQHARPKSASSPFNAALQKIKGYDFQLDYNWDMWGGTFSFRHLATYQPTNSTLNTPASLFYTVGGAARADADHVPDVREQRLERGAAESLAGQRRSQDQRQQR